MNRTEFHTHFMLVFERVKSQLVGATAAHRAEFNFRAEADTR